MTGRYSERRPEVVAALSGRSRGSANSTSEAPRALIMMNEILGSLVALTLQHGRYETRRSTDQTECRALLNEWSPHLVFIDLDLYEPFIDLVGRGLAQGHTPILGFTRRRDTGVKLSAYERGADDILEVPFTPMRSSPARSPSCEEPTGSPSRSCPRSTSMASRSTSSNSASASAVACSTSPQSSRPSCISLPPTPEKR